MSNPKITCNSCGTPDMSQTENHYVCRSCGMTYDKPQFHPNDWKAPTSPLPWSIKHIGSSKAFGGSIEDANGNQVAMVTVTRNGSHEERTANAALIVRAVNNTVPVTAGEWEIQERGDGLVDLVNSERLVATGLTKQQAFTAKTIHNADLTDEREKAEFARSVLRGQLDIQHLRAQLEVKQHELDTQAKTVFDALVKVAGLETKFATAIKALKEFEGEYPHITRILEGLK